MVWKRAQPFFRPPCKIGCRGTRSISNSQRRRRSGTNQQHILPCTSTHEAGTSQSLDLELTLRKCPKKKAFSACVLTLMAASRMRQLLRTGASGIDGSRCWSTNLVRGGPRRHEKLFGACIHHPLRSLRILRHIFGRCRYSTGPLLALCVCSRLCADIYEVAESALGQLLLRVAV